MTSGASIDVETSVNPASPGKPRSCRRIVKPRKPVSNAQKPIVTVDIREHIYTTEDGDTGTLSELVVRLEELQPSIFVCRGIPELVSILHEYHQYNDHWQFSLAPGMREKWSARAEERRKNGKNHRMFTNLIILNWFGFMYAKSNRKKKNVMHFCLDPIIFADRAIQNQPVTLSELTKWAQEVREFCVSENLSIRATQGGIARQYLKDARFYPEARRKVPRATNDKCRDQLGQNHYCVRASFNKQYTARYIDQHAAHHYQVQNLELPDSNHLYGYGHFRTLQGIWKTDPERIRSFIEKFKGLLLVTLDYTPLGLRWVPDYLHKYTPGTPVYVYSCELDLLFSVGAKVTSIIAAWGSFTTDTGLPAFAKYAQTLVDTLEYDWLKPLLLSVYGCLATRPKKTTFGFAKSDKGSYKELRAGRRVLPCYLHETTRAIEPVTNNVIHRGMIEAATRAESLLYANWLQYQGFRVLAIYVDAVIVEEDYEKEIPILPPWRDKQPLSNLQFISHNSFTSVEMTKTPGIPNRETVLRLIRGTNHGPRLGSGSDMLERKMRAWEDQQAGR